MMASSSMRRAYGEALVELGRQREDVVVLSADVSNSDYSFLFQESYPQRFINVGIAEQALIDVAAGLAYEGMVPFANTFAFLLSTRALEMVRTTICYGGANVKLMGAFAGLSDSYDGPTHHSITDLSIMRSLPGMTVVIPSDPGAVTKLLPQVAEWGGPVFFRLNRNEVPVLFGDEYSPRIGQAMTLREGTDLTLIGTGMLVGSCLEAAETLSQEGIDARVVELHTLKPLDAECVLRAARETGALVTAEEHSILGGLGGAVAEVVVEDCPVPVRRVGLRDRFAESGGYSDLLARYGMTAEHVVQAAREVLKAKCRRGP
jgi:transketolase